MGGLDEVKVGDRTPTSVQKLNIYSHKSLKFGSMATVLHFENESLIAW